MSAPKVTGWYSGDQVPARKGVYQRDRPQLSSLVMCSYWTGKHWGLLAQDPQRAFLWRKSRSSFQRARWRGLAEKP